MQPAAPETPETPDRSDVFQLPVAGEPSFVRVGPRSISLGRGADVLNWDRAGRPFAGSLGGTTWHRALDGRMVEIVTLRGSRRARWMDAGETAAWCERLRGWAEQVRDSGHAPAISDAFAPAAAFDAEAWARDAAAFASVYRPVSILPPDQYLALVLQPTIGCPWNRCTFCDFYRDRPHQVRTTGEFREHVLRVRAFFGAGIGARRSIFLGDANAIAAPVDTVVEWLDVIRDEFPVRMPSGLTSPARAGDPPSGFNGIHGFLDVIGGTLHDAAGWARLAAAGLGTVFLGVETGNDRLLHLLGKPGSAAAVADLVPRIKSAGIAVGLIFLAGIGGREMAAAHERDSAALVDALPLDRGDLVYISPLDDRPGAPYRRVEQEAGLTPQDEGEAWSQAERLKGSMTTLARKNGPRGAIYDVRLFAY